MVIKVSGFARSLVFISVSMMLAGSGVLTIGIFFIVNAVNAAIPIPTASVILIVVGLANMMVATSIGGGLVVYRLGLDKRISKL